MLLDANGNPIQRQADDMEWDEIEDTSDSFDHLWGGSDQVLMDAYTHNTGLALATSDLYTEGNYPLHIEKGAEVWLEKERTNIGGASGKYKMRIRVLVHPWRWKLYHKKLQEMKDQWKDVTGESKPWYHVESFVVAILTAIHGVHPMQDEEAFERVLWREMPEAWISPEFAPKDESVRKIR